MFVLEKIANNQQHLDLILDDDYDFIKIIARNVAANIQPSSLLTMYFAAQDGIFDTSSKYMNTGIMSWGGEPNSQYGANPYALGLPQTLNLGCRVGIDVGERESLALNSNIDITNFGTLNGAAKSPTYIASGNIGFIGGITGVSFKPDYLGGGKWFPDDPPDIPFDWSATYLFGGHYSNPGCRVRQIRFSMDGGGTYGRLIKQGYFRIEANKRNLSGVIFTPIGDFNSSSNAIDGNFNKAAGAGAWKVGVDGWIGKTGTIPWAASVIKLYGSNNDGFIFGHLPTPFAQITAKLYESDAIPLTSIDGTLVDTQTITDNDSIPIITLAASGQNKLSRWVVLTHNQTSKSMYISAIV